MKYVALLLAACTPIRAPLTVPETIVWVQSYHQDPQLAPIVQWETGVTCPNNPQYKGILEYCNVDAAYCVNNVQCNAGEYWPDYNWAPVVIESTMHQSALAHEFLHAYLLITTGDGDMNHTGPDWTGLLPQTVLLLENDGY